MSTRVLLIRHPESAWNCRGIYQGQRDIPLSALGRVQAERVALHLRHEPIAGVICSPLQRARTMATAIARYHQTIVQPDDRITEIAHGPWEGLTRNECERHFPEMYRAWTEQPASVTFPGGESLQHVHDRAIPMFEALLSRTESGTWVVAAHDTVCRLVVAAANGQPVTGFSDVNLENAGITTLQGPSLTGSVHRVNDVAHLGDYRVNLGVQAL
jgi:phosphoserine phosphatase